MNLRRALSNLVLVTCVATVSCGAPKRPEVPADELYRHQQSYLHAVAEERLELLEIGLRRMKREWDDYVTTGGTPPVRDILILSGGGAKGAFGAGFLDGWDSIESGPMALPEFDTVTGVSTGALIAPFAFVGTSEAYDTIFEFYRNPRDDWVKKRKPFAFWPSRVSMFDNENLEAYIREHVGEDLIRHVARGAEEDRVLLIGATNLDQGRMRVWNLCVETRDALESDALDRIQSMLLASAAIPAAFPPVEIDGDMYVDGGASEQLYALGDTNRVLNPAAIWRERHPGVPLPKVRIWIIVNTRLELAPEVTQPRWGTIVGRSLSTLMRASLVSTLQRLQATAEMYRTSEDADVEFRYVAIPNDYSPIEGDEMFDKEIMTALSDLGRRMGADPSSWRTGVPSIAWASAEPE
jgi:patatin-like phospholipase/acyl hydrolase